MVDLFLKGYRALRGVNKVPVRYNIFKTYLRITEMQISVQMLVYEYFK